MFEQWDAHAVLYLNAILRDHSTLTRIVVGLAMNPIARGGPVIFPLLMIWFSGDYVQKRGRILLGLIGVCVATLAAVFLQTHLNVLVRPILDPKLHLYLIGQGWIEGFGDHINSFPSDTATLVFALSTVVFLEWRLAGAIAYGWAVLTVGICRMALGLHYATDAIAAFILGVGTVYLFMRPRIAADFVERLLERSNSWSAWIDAALFLFLADANGQFQGLRGLLRFLGMTSY